MSEDQQRIELIRMALGKDWEPHVGYPATFHSRRRSEGSDNKRCVENADTMAGDTKPRQNLLSRLMGRLNLRLTVK